MTEYGICPILNVIGGERCVSECEWYIEGQGCAVAVIAKHFTVPDTTFDDMAKRAQEAEQ